MKSILIALTIFTLSACSDQSDTIKTSTSAALTTSLDSKDLMKCAAETNAVMRLSCFDDLTKANGLTSSSIATSSHTNNNWIIYTDNDPLTDKSIHYAMIEATQGAGRFGEPISLIIRCSAGRTETYINWSTYLGNDGLSVTSRIDKEPASKTYWTISTDYKASFMPQPVASLKKLEGASSFVVNLTPYSESPITAIFEVTGAKDAFKHIREDCNW